MGGGKRYGDLVGCAVNGRHAENGGISLFFKESADGKMFFRAGGGQRENAVRVGRDFFRVAVNHVFVPFVTRIDRLGTFREKRNEAGRVDDHVVQHIGKIALQVLVRVRVVHKFCLRFLFEFWCVGKHPHGVAVFLCRLVIGVLSAD